MVTRTTVHYWEKRGALPSEQSLRKLAEGFEMDHLDLMNELLAWESVPRRTLARTR